MNELVSIIMPSYNTAKYIVDSVESVIGTDGQDKKTVAELLGKLDGDSVSVSDQNQDTKEDTNENS